MCTLKPYPHFIILNTWRHEKFGKKLTIGSNSINKQTNRVTVLMGFRSETQVSLFFSPCSLTYIVENYCLMVHAAATRIHTHTHTHTIRYACNAPDIMCIHAWNPHDSFSFFIIIVIPANITFSAESPDVCVIYIYSDLSCFNYQCWKQLWCLIHYCGDCDTSLISNGFMSQNLLKGNNRTTLFKS